MLMGKRKVAARNKVKIRKTKQEKRERGGGN